MNKEEFSLEELMDRAQQSQENVLKKLQKHLQEETGTFPQHSREYGQWESYTIKEARQCSDGDYEIHTTTPTGFIIRKERIPESYTPKKGDHIEIHTDGSRIVGMRVVLYDMTYGEYQQERKQETEEIHKGWDESYKKYLETFNEKINLIDHRLKYKVLTMHNNLINAVANGQDEDHSKRGGADYNLFIYIEASKLLKRFTRPGDINKYYHSPLKEQKEMCPEIDYEAHSGNTFGSACSLAKKVLVTVGEGK